MVSKLWGACKVDEDPRGWPRRGFLPSRDPLARFSRESGLNELDAIGAALPDLLVRGDFRQWARNLQIPPWPRDILQPGDLPALRLYYVRTGFLASAYVNQVGQPPVRVLPENLAAPLVHACRLLGRPPILSYDGYALYNWRRLDPDGPVALGNIDTLQNFVPLYDEHWFILVHVEIEAIGARVVEAIGRALDRPQDDRVLAETVDAIARALGDQVRVLRRIPEHMDDRLYYRTFRPYIRFFQNVEYAGQDLPPLSFRGETGAQSSLMPAVVAFLGIPHRATGLTDHLDQMRRYMPARHRAFVGRAGSLTGVRERVPAELFNAALEAVAEFREVHLGWARAYIQRWEADPRGTGGTPYMDWLQQLVDETRAWKLGG